MQASAPPAEATPALAELPLLAAPRQPGTEYIDDPIHQQDGDRDDDDDIEYVDEEEDFDSDEFELAGDFKRSLKGGLDEVMDQDWDVVSGGEHPLLARPSRSTNNRATTDTSFQ